MSLVKTLIIIFFKYFDKLVLSFPDSQIHKYLRLDIVHVCLLYEAIPILLRTQLPS